MSKDLLILGIVLLNREILMKFELGMNKILFVASKIGHKRKLNRKTNMWPNKMFQL